MSSGSVLGPSGVGFQCLPSRALLVDPTGQSVQVFVEEVTVNRQSERRRAVAHYRLDGFRGCARRDHSGCGGVTEGVDASGR